MHLCIYLVYQYVFIRFWLNLTDVLTLLAKTRSYATLDLFVMKLIAFISNGGGTSSAFSRKKWPDSMKNMAVLFILYR
jgi:hypothetical protein